MKKFTFVNLDKFIDDFSQLEQKITQLNGRNNILEIKLDETNRVLKFSSTKEKCLIEERDVMMGTVKELQQTIQQQCDLRDENEKLKNSVADLKQQNDRVAEDGEFELQRLVAEMRSEGERHKRELETMRQQYESEMQDNRKETLRQLADKDAEVEMLLEGKESEAEEMRKRLQSQERERQSEVLKLQMEFGAKLARVQSSQRSQQQLQGCSQNIYKRKLQFLQEEKNREIETLRERIQDLEDGHHANWLTDGRLKRKKI